MSYKVKGGGSFGCWTLRRINIYFNHVQPGISVEQTKNGYVVTDREYRPDYRSEECRTPASAIRSAGMYLPKCFPSYLEG